MTSLNNFVRKDGMFGGVAGGLAYSLDIPVVVIRLLMFVSFFLTFGLTLFFYFAAVFSFPTDLHLAAFGEGPKIFGVCYKLSPKLKISPPWLRFITLTLGFFTAYLPVIVLYFVAHLILNEEKPARRNYSSGNFRDVN